MLTKKRVMKRNVNEALLNSLKERAKEELVLYSDASYSRNQFAICNEDGEVVYYGFFFKKPDNQAIAKLEAARKAIWVAKRYKKHKQIDALKLVLYVDAECLIFQKNPKQKGYVLTQMCMKNDIYLIIKWIPTSEMPVDLHKLEIDKMGGQIYYKLYIENDL